MHDKKAQWSRTIAGILSMFFGFYAMSRLPLGDAVTLGNLTPLMIAIASQRMLGERAGGGLALAIVLGFVGVAVLAGAQLHSHGALLAIGSGVIGAFCSCMAMIFLRRLGPRESAEGVSLHFALWATLAMLLVGVGRQVVPSPSALLSLVLAGFTGGVAQVAMTKAYALDKAARVGAVGYSGVVFAQILGVLFLHEIPSVRQLAGAALVVLSGVFLVSGALRERWRARA